MNRTAEHATGTSDSGTVAARRARGIALIAGAIVLLAFVQTDVLAFYWLPLILGLTYLAAAAAGRSRGTLWSPGLITTVLGVSIALWFRAGRPADSFELLALTVLSLGLGAVLAAGLSELRGFSISAMSIAVPVLLIGAFLLAEHQGVPGISGQVWVYAAGLAVWGAYELRPARS